MFRKILMTSLCGISSGIVCPAQNGLPSSAGKTDTLGLQQAVDIGIAHNLQVNLAELQMHSSQVNLEQARASMLPVINGVANQTIGFGRTLNTYDYTYTNQVNSGNYGINGSLNLFSGLQVRNTIQQNKYTLAADKMDVQQQKDNLTLSIVLAYLQVISCKELVTIAKDQAGVDSVQWQRLKILKEEGALLLLSDLSDIEGKYAEDKANIAIAVNNLEAAKIGLFELLNVPYAKHVVFDYSAPAIPCFEETFDTNDIYEAARRSNPSLQSAAFKVHARAKALRVAKGRFYPGLSFFGGLTTNYYSLAYKQVATTTSANQATPYYFFQEGKQINVLTSNQNYDNLPVSFGSQFRSNGAAAIGLQLSIPLLNSFRARSNVRLAKLDLANAQRNEQTVRHTLQRQIESASQQMISACQQYRSYAAMVTAYTESFRIAQIRFLEGIINADVYVLAKNNLDRSNLNLVIARYNYIFRTKVMDYYQGNLSL